MSSTNRSARRVFRRALGPRGASTVEYAVILVAVLLLAAGSWKVLGGALGKRSNVAGDTVSGGGSSSGGGGSLGGGGGSRGGGGSGGGGGGGGDKASAASKVSVGGVGGAAGESGGAPGKASRDTSSESSGDHGGGPIGSVGGRDTGGGDVAEGFTPKRWFGVGLLAAGVFALGYVVMSMRRAKKAADDIGKDAKGNKAPKGPAAPPPLA
ncbi:MAG: hypothetical protein KF795_05720 [Labilithrix sp.]|nr:hypothetical protein [Labilithrix sp.]